MKLLNVKAIKKKELTAKWDGNFGYAFHEDGTFIRCNAKGEINWGKAPLYTLEQLRLKENVKVHI
ncbi:hypothetical protein D3C87_719980 [compost metagenome]